MIVKSVIHFSVYETFAKVSKDAVRYFVVMLSLIRTDEHVHGASVVCVEPDIFDIEIALERHERALVAPLTYQVAPTLSKAFFREDASENVLRMLLGQEKRISLPRKGRKLHRDCTPDEIHRISIEVLGMNINQHILAIYR